VVDQKRKKYLPAWVVDEMKRLWKGNPMQTLLIRGRFRMAYCRGVDVSKQSLEIWDGTQEEEVPNEKGLTTLKKLLKKRYGTN